MRNIFSQIARTILPACLFAMLIVVSAQAATLTVDTTIDDATLTACTPAANDCSLRGAITIAAPGDTITFDSSFTFAPRSIPLTDGALVINKSLTITSVGSLIIVGDGSDRVFDISGSGVTVSLSGMTITGGNPASGIGSGIRNAQSTLNLTNVTVTGNRRGGIGITSGTVNLTNSTVSDNQSCCSVPGIELASSSSAVTVTGSTIIGNIATPGVATSGAGIGGAGASPSITVTNSAILNNIGVRGGGIYGNPTVTNSTISGNRTRNTTFGEGGGIYSLGGGTLTNVTITNNSAFVRGGGIYNFFTSSGGPVIRNSIVAGSNTTFGGSSDIEGTITSQGNNLVQNRGSSTGYVASDLPNGTNPMLDILKNNGGLSVTHALLPGSPAINAGNNAFAVGPNDQRGPGFARIVGSAVDIGAFEVQGATAAAVSVAGQVTTAEGRGINKAQVIMSSNAGVCFAQTNPFGFYRFEGVPAGETYVFNALHKRYLFSPQILTVTEQIDNLNFVAAP